MSLSLSLPSSLSLSLSLSISPGKNKVNRLYSPIKPGSLLSCISLTSEE
jgi:hypothetical protein